MSQTVDLTDSYEVRDVAPDEEADGWESWVEWAADRYEDGGDPAVDPVEFEVHRGLVEAVDHRTTEEDLSGLDLTDEERAEELAERNATVDDEWDIDPVVMEDLVASDIGPIEENDVGRDAELGGVYPSDEIPDLDEDGVETVTVRLPLREGVATALDETVAGQDRDTGEFLRGLVVHQAAHINGPRGPTLDAETRDALPEEERARIHDAREDAMAEWLGKVARGEDVEAATKEGWNQIATVQAEVTGQLDATEGESAERSGEER